jgi:hypothetical protein
MKQRCEQHIKENQKRAVTYSLISSAVLGFSRGINSTQLKSPRPNLLKHDKPHHHQQQQQLRATKSKMQNHYSKPNPSPTNC